MDLRRRYHEIEQLWVSQSWAEWARTCSPRYRFRPGVGPERDIQQTRAWSVGLFAGFPDLSQRIERVIVSDDSVAGVVTLRGTHTGELDLGLGHSIPATGRPIEVPYIKVITFDEDGLAELDRQYLDIGSLGRQLRGIPDD